MIELPTGGFFSSAIRDLSTSGAFVLTKRTVELGIVRRRPEASGSDIAQADHLRTSAKVCRWTALGWGLAFVDPTPDLIAAIRRVR